MTTTLVLSEQLAESLRAVATDAVETAGVLLVKVVRPTADDIRLLGRKIVWVPRTAYFRREAESLSITSDGYVGALGEAGDTGAIGIWLHTHPGSGSSPLPSQRDLKVDRELAELFRLRTGNEFYGSVIVSHENGHLRFKGHLETENERLEIDRLWVVGQRLSLTHSWDHSAEKLPDLFDRNVRALGGEVQRVLQDLRIGVVGCGGIGSCVAEQLVRLGVRQFVLVDPDTLSASNLTRVYGSTAADIGRRKVDIVADNLARISPEACSTRIASMITCEAIARQLVELDLVFGCTDDNAGRLVLSRLATYMLIPVIDCGVILTSNRDGLLDGIDGRVTTLTPGSACLVCRGRIDLERARSELLTPEERVRREDEGYAPALRGVEPAVVAYTTLVAATAIGELLERLVHYGSDLTPSETLLRVHEREISTNVQLPRERHYCHPDSGKLGLGLTEPFLEQTWPA